MLINAAPRSYTSNIVADADLNLEGYNVTANALYSKDNYLLTMLDYGEAFPTDVKEGDKLFAWGEDSTKSYIYTYKQGSWDAGVKPHHMVDYYIADEGRTVKFYFVRPINEFVSYSVVESGIYEYMGLIFGPDVYIMGSFRYGYSLNVWSSSPSYPYSMSVWLLYFGFFGCETDGTYVYLDSQRLLEYDSPSEISSDVVVPSKSNSFYVWLNCLGLYDSSGSDTCVTQACIDFRLYYGV